LNEQPSAADPAMEAHSLDRLTPAKPTRRHWTLADIPWGEVRREDAAACDELFYLVATASLMESATDLYTQNLIEFFAGDDEITDWLTQYWLPEELQHGRALRHYVETAWPEFGWAGVNQRFVEEFRPYCDTALEAARSLEMASRCVVEMGTASYYTTLSRASPEPVLRQLTRRIVEDEVRHYKHFYRFFKKYRDLEQCRRSAVAPALWRRLQMTNNSDSFVPLKHVYRARHPGAEFDAAVYRAVRRRCRDFLREHFPLDMSARMLLKPLDLGPRTQRLALAAITALARHVAL
jgi:rubrerythrin